MNNVRHLNTAFNFFKMMLVVPHGVRAKALFIYKIFTVFYLGNFRHPVERNTKQWAYGVFNNLPCVNRIAMVFGDNIKTQFIRRNFLKILWIGKE